MDKALVEKWVAALRSGEYQQGRGYLRTGEDQYCCLGVGYDVLVKEGLAEPWVLSVSMIADNTPAYETGQDGSLVFLPHEDAIMLGVESTPGIDRSKQTVLTQMNDVDNASFAVIADYIELAVLGHESVTSVSSTESG
jgi:hypothetical protein